MSEKPNNVQNLFIFSFSLLLVVFLTWFIYFKETGATDGIEWVSKLPALNAFLNLLTSIFLMNGYIAIKRGKRELHIKLMLTAVVTSLLFLITYLTYHHFHGDTKFLAQGGIRIVYFFILISHIVLSIVLVPLVSGTLLNAYKKNYISHKKWAKWAFPVWMYVSVTGVLIYIFIKVFNNVL